MPFTPASTDPDQEYLTDGLTEDLIDHLARVPDLKVIARSSVFRYKGQPPDPWIVADQLGVRAAVVGRISQRDNDLAIDVELVDAPERRRLWGAQYQGILTDLAATQATLARAITDVLRPQWSRTGPSAQTALPTRSAESYRLYLKGRFFMNKRTGPDSKKGVDHIQQAIAKDPGFAPAYAALAFGYLLLSDYGFLPPAEAVAQARALATRALTLDPTLTEAHGTLARIIENHDWDLPGAEAALKRILAQAPGAAGPHDRYSRCLSEMGRHTEAIAEAKRAHELDPLALPIQANLGRRFFFARQYDQAVAEYLKVLDMDRHFAVAYYHLGQVYTQQGKFQEAIAALQTGRQLDDTPDKRAMLGYAFARSGQRDRALEIIDELQTLSKTRFVSQYRVAAIYAGLGEKDQALACLEQAYHQRDDRIIVLKIDPALDDLRADPRFQGLVQRVGFPPE